GDLVGPDHSKRTGEILRAANGAEEEQEHRVQNLQSDLGRSLSELTEARSAAERSPDVSQALQTIAGTNLSLPSDPRARSEVLRGHIATKRAELQQVENSRLQSETLASEFAYLRSPEAARELALAESTVQSA